MAIDQIPGAKLVCVHDHAGNLLLGKAPPPDPCTLSADFLMTALTMGYKPNAR